MRRQGCQKPNPGKEESYEDKAAVHIRPSISCKRRNEDDKNMESRGKEKEVETAKDIGKITYPDN